MRYDRIREGVFVTRLNRFVAQVKVDGRDELCHVKNTGRLGELLVPGTRAWVQEHEKSDRKTKYSLIAVEREGLCYNIDSQAPNHLAGEWLESGKAFSGRTVSQIRKEQKYGNSRFDLMFQLDGKKTFMEVKGVTLNQNGTALFPDAPTLRGEKHVRELTECLEQGYGACILFVVKFETAQQFAPNTERQPEFAEALKSARQAGVLVMAAKCRVTPEEIRIEKEIPVIL